MSARGCPPQAREKSAEAQAADTTGMQKRPVSKAACAHVAAARVHTERCCSLGAVLSYLDELLEEVGGQGVLLAGALGAMKLAVILDIHALARIWVILIILIIIIQLHVHPVKYTMLVNTDVLQPVAMVP